MTNHRITHLGHMGDGIANGPVYAPMTAPGDVVEGTLTGERLSDIKIVTPSDLRVKAPCKHFKSCGGCALQHLPDDFVAEWKRDIVVNAMKAHDLQPEVLPTLTSPPASRRRATFAARRGKSGAVVGFHGRRSDSIVQIPACTLLEPDLLRALDIVDELCRVGGSRRATLDATATITRNGLDLSIDGGKPLDHALRSDLAQIAEAARLCRLTWAGETVALRQPSIIDFDGIDVDMPPGAFLQATRHGEVTLRDLVKRIIGPSSNIVDLFSGCGTFALPLARGASVSAYEAMPDMISALDAGWRHGAGLKRVRSSVRDLFRNPLLPDELKPFDAIVIDPPRAGAAAQIKAIADSAVPIVAHVSCNPQTFARDAAVLVGSGYALEWVQPVDQFRWSPHIELVGAFVRK